MNVNHYVCNYCGHRWPEVSVVQCPACNCRIVNVWSGAGAEANAKAQALRISREKAAGDVA